MRRMERMAQRGIMLIVGLLGVATIVGCDEETALKPCPSDGSGGQTATPNLNPQGRASLFVDVYDAEEKTPLDAVQVGVDLRMRTSDLLGRVLLDNIPPGQKTVSFFSPNHIPMRMASKLPELSEGDELRAGMRAFLKPLTLLKECNASAVCEDELDGVRISIPAEALRDNSNAVITGSYKVYVSRLNPDTDLQLLPGSVNLVDPKKGNLIPLRVWSMVSLEARQESRPLQLIAGKPASLEMLIPNAPSTPPLGMASHFQDEKSAEWVLSEKPGEMLVDATGKTTWKTDLTQLGLHACAQQAEPGMRLSLTVVDADGKTRSGIYVQATSSKHRSHVTGFTGQGGLADLTVPEDADAEPAFDIRLPGLADKPTLEWKDLKNGVRPLVVKLAAIAAGDACSNAGESRICGDASSPVTCYTKYQFCDGQAWGLCSKLGEQKVELCNGIDDDCDGAVDGELTEAGVPCDTGKPGACSLGRSTKCVGGNLECAEAVQATAETCNGIDDDCDGTVDNKIDGLGVACTPDGAQGGQCASGTTVCQNGVLFCQAANAMPETCNGQDDDCNGAIDDGLGTTTCGVGACVQTVNKCENGVPQTCMPLPPAPSETCLNDIDDDCDGEVDESCCDATLSSCPTSPEVCDGIDNDRDGRLDALDEDLLDAKGMPIHYRCCPTDSVEIPGDGIDNDCNGPIDGTAECLQVTEILDGSDNNCNGLIDEPPATTCDRNTPEICDGVDQDCDGIADSGLCCDATWNSLFKCHANGGGVGNSPLVHDSNIGIGATGNHQIIGPAYGIHKYVGAKYVLPMKKEVGQKNRWYWEVAVSPNNSTNSWCIGIGKVATPMVSSDARLDTKCLTVAEAIPANGQWSGAVVSVLVDLAEVKIWYWVNGVPTASIPLDPDTTYYPMSWIYTDTQDVLTHNFGPDFRYPISNLFDVPKPAP